MQKKEMLGRNAGGLLRNEKKPSPAVLACSRRQRTQPTLQNRVSSNTCSTTCTTYTHLQNSYLARAQAWRPCPNDRTQPSRAFLLVLAVTGVRKLPGASQAGNESAAALNPGRSAKCRSGQKLQWQRAAGGGAGTKVHGSLPQAACSIPRRWQQH